MLKRIIVIANIFALIGVLYYAPINFKFLDPISKALGDFDIYDLYYTQLRDEPKADTNIVLVNIGNLNREQIAWQVSRINQYEPKVIGIDALFWQPKDSAADMQLAAAFSSVKNLVIVSKLEKYNDDTGVYDTMETSMQQVNCFARNGYANLPNDEKGSFRTIRRYRPFVNTSKGKANSFTSEIIRLIDSSSYKQLLQRDLPYEIIHYRGNINKYYSIDAADLFDPAFDPVFLKDKIVLMGYMGPSFAEKTLEDIFFTPLNPAYAGRDFPDMYGIVIHANIISMVMHSEYVDQMSGLVSLPIAILLCLLNVIIIPVIQKKLPLLSGTLVKLFLSAQTIGSVYLSFIIFAEFNYKINLTLAMALIVLVPSSLDFFNTYELRLIEYIKLKKKNKQHENA